MVHRMTKLQHFNSNVYHLKNQYRKNSTLFYQYIFLYCNIYLLWDQWIDIHKNFITKLLISGFTSIHPCILCLHCITGPLYIWSMWWNEWNGSFRLFKQPILELQKTHHFNFSQLRTMNCRLILPSVGLIWSCSVEGTPFICTELQETTEAHRKAGINTTTVNDAISNKQQKAAFVIGMK